MGFPMTERQFVKFQVDWQSYPNDDIADEDDPNPSPDEGWYIDLTLPDGTGGEIGPDFYGPGLQSLDAALELIEKWATDRGIAMTRDMIEFNVTIPLPKREF
jgi:hypothetical protein